MDVLEAIDSSLTSVQEKIDENNRSSPNIRLLKLHLSQIETVINILEKDAKLELEMSLEVKQLLLKQIYIHILQHFLLGVERNVFSYPNYLQKGEE